MQPQKRTLMQVTLDRDLYQNQQTPAKPSIDRIPSMSSKGKFSLDLQSDSDKPELLDSKLPRRPTHYAQKEEF